MKKKLFIIFFVFIVSSYFVSAFSISPANKYFDYEIFKVQESEIRILNNDKIDMKILVEKEGKMADFIEIKDNIIDISEDQGVAILKYNFTVFRELDPGQHISLLKFTDINEKSGENSLIGFRTTVSSSQRVDVPYEGLHIEYDAFPYQGDGYYGFSFIIKNKGTQNLSEGSIQLNVLDDDDDPVYYSSLTDINVGSESTKRMDIKWPGYEKGKYTMETKFIYSGKEINRDKDFIIPDPKEKEKSLGFTGLKEFDEKLIFPTIIILIFVVILVAMLIFQFINWSNIKKERLIERTLYRRRGKR